MNKISKVRRKHKPFGINLLEEFGISEEVEKLKQTQKEAEEVVNIDYWVMLRDLDGQYHQVFNEMSYKVMEEAQQQILDLNK